MQRYTVHFTGRVQGVGFRYTAQHIAATHDISGFVQNLADGRVLLVAEGESAALDAYLAELTSEMGRHIRDTRIEKCEANGEFGRPGIDPLTVRR